MNIIKHLGWNIFWNIMEHSWNKSLSIIKLINHTSAIHILRDRLGTNSRHSEWLIKLLDHTTTQKRRRRHITGFNKVAGKWWLRMAYEYLN